MGIKDISKKADWEKLEKRPTWGTVTSMELSQILGVPLQSINNWLVRGSLPDPEPRQRGQGNKNRYCISKIRSWLEGQSEDDIHWAWIKQHMGDDFQSLEQAQDMARLCWDVYGIERV